MERANSRLKTRILISDCGQKPADNSGWKDHGEWVWQLHKHVQFHLCTKDNFAFMANKFNLIHSPRKGWNSILAIITTCKITSLSWRRDCAMHAVTHAHTLVMLYTKMNVLGVTTVASYYTERLSHLHSPYIYSLHQKPHQTVDNFSIYFDDMIWDIDIETMCLHCDIYRSLTSSGCFCNDVTLTRMLIHLSFISCSAWNERWTKRILEVAWKLYILVETIYWLKVLILFKFTHRSWNSRNYGRCWS